MVKISKNGFQGALSRSVRLEMVILKFSSFKFVIRVNLLYSFQVLLKGNYF